MMAVFGALITGLFLGLMLGLSATGPDYNSLMKGTVTEIGDKKYVCQVVEEKTWVKP